MGREGERKRVRENGGWRGKQRETDGKREKKEGEILRENEIKEKINKKREAGSETE